MQKACQVFPHWNYSIEEEETTTVIAKPGILPCGNEGLRSWGCMTSMATEVYILSLGKPSAAAAVAHVIVTLQKWSAHQMKSKVNLLGIIIWGWLQALPCYDHKSLTIWTVSQSQAWLRSHVNRMHPINAYIEGKRNHIYD